MPKSPTGVIGQVRSEFGSVVKEFQPPQRKSCGSGRLNDGRLAKSIQALG
jgi:hypothetical protein